jgi:hypothetical protein
LPFYFGEFFFAKYLFQGDPRDEAFLTARLLWATDKILRKFEASLEPDGFKTVSG